MTRSTLVIVVLFIVGLATIAHATLDPTTAVDPNACVHVEPASVDSNHPLESERSRLQRAQAECRQRNVLLAHPGHASIALLAFGGAFLLLNLERLPGFGSGRARRNIDDAPLPSTLVIPELNLHGVVADPAGAVWWIDVPAVGPSRLVGTWPAAEKMHVLVGVAGTWTEDLGVHAGGCDLHVQLPSPRACICVASATVRDLRADPIIVRMTVDLPGEQVEARLVA